MVERDGSKRKVFSCSVAQGTMTDLLDDLVYLQREAFEFTLSINPHASYHETIEAHLSVGVHEDEDWLSPEQRREAVQTQKFVSGSVYPKGSVGFYTVHGTDLPAVIAECARLCREDRAR
jgi:hypothetical protein